jgi:hypothetical protein
MNEITRRPERRRGEMVPPAGEISPRLSLTFIDESPSGERKVENSPG